jgi:hypothetical protein
VIGAAVVVAVALASTFAVFQAGSGALTGPTSGYATSADGLKLTLQISGSRIQLGGSVTINVTETNTNAKALNESAASRWAVQGLRMSTCYASVYPFGVAVYEGHYSKNNLSSGTRLNLYPFEPCPMLVRYISGYYFSSRSDFAEVLPGTGAPIPMTSGLVASGNYVSGNSKTIFASGEYTVVAGDEWGSLVLLSFVVS